MAVNMSLKNVSEEVAAKFRQRARSNHRSVQGELMAVVEASVAEPQRPDLDDILARIRALGLTATSSSVEIVREMRDTRYGDQGR